MREVKAPAHSWEELVASLQTALGHFTLAEVALAAVFVSIALVAPRVASGFFGQIESRFAALSRNPMRQIVAVGVLAIVARAVMLPWLGVPVPVVFDEQSIFLQGQTFAAGRLANPTHPLWEHFETYFVNHLPAYASMYFPGRGAPLAAGLVLGGNAWVGVWLSVILMCMAATWMLQAWVSLPMALLGGVLVTIRLGIFSNWVNSYEGGAFTAFGAMLVIGALPRILREPRWRHGVAIGLGAAILLNTRPYEGALVCVPVAIVLLARLVRPAWNAGRIAFLRAAVPACVLLGAAGALMLAHNAATTGHVLKTPYQLNRETYAIAPAFVIAAPPVSQQRGPSYFRTFFLKEAEPYLQRGAPGQLVRSLVRKIFHPLNFYVGGTFAISFLAGLWATRREYFLWGAAVCFFAGYFVETWSYPQYTAPVYPLLLILMMRGFEWLRLWQPAGRPAGLFLTRAMPTAAFALLALPLSSITRGAPALPPAKQASCCFVTYFELRRELVSRLLASPGRDLVLVKHGPHDPLYLEMVYNEPDIDKSEVVWAHRLSTEKDFALQRYFADRRVWEFEWDAAAEAGYRLRPMENEALKELPKLHVSAGQRRTDGAPTEKPN